MARVSRKQRVVNEIITSGTHKKIPTAIYVRLSVENSGKSEDKDVIANQIDICKEFLAKQADLSLYEIYEDNGTTGTVFDRPSFNRLMEDIKAGKVGCLVVRDLSRFGRDYVETGTYLERIFPSIGLRFISVKEQYDTFHSDTSNESLMIPLQNMINALYSKDISRKVVSAHKTRMRSGDFKKSTIAYGYKLSEDRRRIVIDEECAKFVAMMFQWRADGITVADIGRKLDALNAPNPRKRKVETGVRKSESKPATSWNRSTISKLLTNPIYTGDTITGRTETAFYKGISRHDVTNRLLWNIIPNTHDPIVSKEKFDLVQEMILSQINDKKSKFAESEKDRKKISNLFEGKIFCADCKEKMYFKKNCNKGTWFAVYKCSSYTRKLGTGCDSHYITSTELNQKVLDAIKTQVKVALDYEKLIAKLKVSAAEKSIRDRYNSMVTSLTLKANDVNRKRLGLYDDYVEGILTESEYVTTKQYYDVEYNKLNKKLEEAITKRAEFRETISSENKWVTLMKSVRNMRKLTESIVHEVIESVHIHSDRSIELTMKYQDIYALTVLAVKEIEQEVA